MRYNQRRGIVGQRVLTIILVTVGAAAHTQAAPVTLWNEVDGQGSLTLTTDDYGSFGVWLDWPDLFDMGPQGDPSGEQTFTFATSPFVFIDPSTTGAGTHRGVLSTHALLLDLYTDANVFGTVTNPNAIINVRTAASGFDVQGDGMNLGWTLTQTVSPGFSNPSGQNAILEQTYTITNNGNETLEFIVVKHIDHDLPGNSGGPFQLDDLVGVDFSEFGRAQVYAQVREFPLGAIVLRTREDVRLDPRTVDFVYYVGRQNAPTPPGNFDYPGGECPPHGYGTDTQIWDNYGVPNCWKNFVPGVGYDVPGQSHVDADGGAFIGLQVEAALPPGETYEVTFVTSYGNRPRPDVQSPPVLSTQTIAYDQVTGCAEFLWELRNYNPIVSGKDPVLISDFYIDVEAGDGGAICTDMTPPSGWSVALCAGFNNNGRALYRFYGGTPINLNGEVHGRLKIDTNGMSPNTNPQTGIVVPALSVVLHAAQAQDDATCDFNFGPSNSGEWSIRAVATAYLPVLASATWAKIVLALSITLAGTLLLFRRPPFPA